MASELAPQTPAPGGELQEPSDGENRRALLIGIAVAVLALFLLWLGWLNIAHVPDVRGMDRFHANIALENAGLNLGQVVTTSNGEVHVGEIAVQRPAPGSMLLKGSGVNVAVKSGEVASLLGASGQALAAIATTTTPAKPWWETLPGAGATQAAPAAVEAAQGFGGVPDVEGMTRSDAVSRLNSAGYSVSLHYGPSTTGVPRGRVYYQSPAPHYSGGSPVIVWISTGSLEHSFPFPQPVPDPR